MPGRSRRRTVVDRRTVYVSGLAVLIAFAAGFIAQGLTALIGVVTNLAYYGRWSTAFVSPAKNNLGWLAIFVPVIGGLIVGVMARYGSRAIRGHGIPEAMEQVLINQSRIAPRLTWLKPLSAAIAIGTGGPFGAEGPIIATGGALGSVLGQWIRSMSVVERKTLLAAGAAAGMAATFGSPVSAVLLAIELLLFEYRPRTLIPVSLAAATATGVRIAFVGAAPAFVLEQLSTPSGSALFAYVALGGFVGLVSVGVTRLVYGIEDAFEHLPVHWMWWPAIGGLAVGIVGCFAPRVLGVGYDNIEQILGGVIIGRALVVLCVCKLIAWSIALGSGTSGGTLAPLFTIGGGLGAWIGAALTSLAPGLGVDARLAGLVGMGAMFAGASRALLASVVFAFETTRQPIGLLPLLGGCTCAFLVSSLLMKNSIMTEKIARRGVRVLGEYTADFLDQLRAGDCATSPVITLRSDATIEAARAWLLSGEAGTKHTGYPVIDGQGSLVGLVTRGDLALAASELVFISELIAAHGRAVIAVEQDSSLRDAADRMAEGRVGRLPVVANGDHQRLIGILTRSDLVNAHAVRLDDHRAKKEKAVA